MSEDLLRGRLVRLTAESAKTLAEPYSRSSQDSEYWRLETSDPARLFSVWNTEKELEKFLEKEPKVNEFYFSIRILEGDVQIGDVGLGVVSWSSRDAFVGIGIGERAFWGKGYGTDAMQVALRYAFQELNLRRVTLNTFAYNPRAIRSYEKAGFSHEGRVRGALSKDGNRYDVLYMGILREEWAQKEEK